MMPPPGDSFGCKWRLYESVEEQSARAARE